MLLIFSCSSPWITESWKSWYFCVCLHLLTSQVSKQKTKAMILMWTLYLKTAQDGHQNKSNTKKEVSRSLLKNEIIPPFFMFESFYVLGVMLCVLHISCPLKCFIYGQLLCNFLLGVGLVAVFSGVRIGQMTGILIISFLFIVHCVRLPPIPYQIRHSLSMI